MKVLLIAAQDIKAITLAWVEKGVLICQKDVSVEPDNYLLSLKNFLHENYLEPQHIESIAVITGPGSFTASRVSVMIANTLAWARSLPIFGLENKQNLNLSELLEKFDLDKLNYQESPVLPIYNQKPNITVLSKV